MPECFKFLTFKILNAIYIARQNYSSKIKTSYSNLRYAHETLKPNI